MQKDVKREEEVALLSLITPSTHHTNLHHGLSSPQLLDQKRTILNDSIIMHHDLDFRMAR